MRTATDAMTPDTLGTRRVAFAVEGTDDVLHRVRAHGGEAAERIR